MTMMAFGQLYFIDKKQLLIILRTLVSYLCWAILTKDCGVRSLNAQNEELHNCTLNMPASGILSILEVNVLPAEQFEWLFGNVIEHCPEATRQVAAKRPFATTEALKSAFDDYLEKLDTIGKENVLNKHPDLAGKLAEDKKLTNESQSEQKYAGLDSMTREERQRLNNYNHMYKEKFQFPFVICARENKVAAILAGIEMRLKNTREIEVDTGIQEVKKICRLRINNLVWPDA